MLSFIRKRLTVANGVLVIVLALALSGGAYAASKVLITSIKEISPKVVKQLKGERGAEGAKGAQGAEGKAGEKGAIGLEGKAGETPAMKEFAGKGGSCNEGGVEFTIGAGKSQACNGKSAGSTLEKGKSERGTFAMYMTAVKTGGGEFEGLAQITYPIPLASSVSPPQVEVMGEKETNANCAKKGAEATAAEGVLCVYIAHSLPATGHTGAPIYEIEFDNEPYGCVLDFDAQSQASYLMGEWVLTAS